MPVGANHAKVAESYPDWRLAIPLTLNALPPQSLEMTDLESAGLPVSFGGSRRRFTSNGASKKRNREDSVEPVDVEAELAAMLSTPSLQPIFASVASCTRHSFAASDGTCIDGDCSASLLAETDTLAAQLASVR